MKSFSVDCGISPLIPVLGPAVALLLTLGCSGAGGSASSAGNSTSGGATSDGSSTVNGGSSVPGSTTSSGGNPGSGGMTGKGGNSSTGEIAGSGGSRASGGTPGSGGTEKGGTTGTGGTTTKGGTTSTGTTTSSGGIPGRDAGPGVDGAPGTGSATDGGSTVNCSATMPPASDGKTYTGSSVYGTANGLGYGIWTNGSGGSITVFSTAHAFSASWSESQDFLAHLGLDFRPAKAWTTYGTIAAEFSEVKSGTAGGFSMIGMYGWTNSPCVEWYINEDSWKGLGGGGNITADIDGGTYYLKSVTTTGTGGANACESGHTGSWTQLISTRKTARTCGNITVSDHFAAWEKQGWKMGVLTSVHINVEVGGGTGKIDFPVANVTTTNK